MLCLPCPTTTRDPMSKKVTTCARPLPLMSDLQLLTNEL